MPQQSSGMSFASGVCLCTKVPEVVAVIVAISHDLDFSIMQRREQLAEKPFPAFTWKLIPQTPGSAEDSGKPVVVGCPGGHPIKVNTAQLIDISFHQRTSQKIHTTMQ